jgi:hypothetical protein
VQSVPAYHRRASDHRTGLPAFGPGVKLVALPWWWDKRLPVIEFRCGPQKYVRSALCRGVCCWGAWLVRPSPSNEILGRVMGHNGWDIFRRCEEGIDE